MRVSSSSSLTDHSFTCILSQADRSGAHPPCSARREPTMRSPNSQGSQVERPRFPHAGPFPFSVPPRPRADGRAATLARRRGRRLLRPRSHAAARRQRRGVLRGDARRRAASAARSRASGCCTGCSTRSARRCRRWRSPARRSTLAKGRSRAAVQARRRARPPTGWCDWSSRSPRRCSPSTAPPGGRSCWPPRRRTTSSSRSPTGSGFDDVVATRYGVDADGTYDGTLDGPFVWSTGKLAAVREWADEHDVDLAESYAYSDSVYDTPLLSAVGHPVVVNPDPRMVLIAARPALADAPPRRAAGRAEGAGRRARAAAAGACASPGPRSFPYARFDIDGHRAHPGTRAGDPRRQPPLVLRRRRRWRCRSPRPAAPCASSARRRCSTRPSSASSPQAMGGIRVDRGTGSRRAAAGGGRRARRGEMVAIMPQGTIPRGPAFFDPDAEGPLGCGPPGRS